MAQGRGALPEKRRALLARVDLKEKQMKVRALLAATSMAASAPLSASPVVVDGDGRTIGFYLGVTGDETEQAVSSQGYRFGFDRA